MESGNSMKVLRWGSTCKSHICYFQVLWCLHAKGLNLFETQANRISTDRSWHILAGQTLCCLTNLSYKELLGKDTENWWLSRFRECGYKTTYFGAPCHHLKSPLGCALALAKGNLWLSSGPMVPHNCHGMTCNYFNPLMKTWGQFDPQMAFPWSKCNTITQYP